MKLKKLTACIISVILSAIMAVMSPVQVLAASQTLYIEEVVLATKNTDDEKWTADQCKAWLTKGGYTIVNKDLNAGTDDPPCYLGYKTTTDPSKAITDLSIMDMKGGYSASQYKEMLEKKATDIRETVNSLLSVIKEYQANYKKSSPAANSACNALQMFFDGALESNGNITEDSKKRDTQKQMGAFFLSIDTAKSVIPEGATGEEIMKNPIVKVFMESNATILDVMIKQLSYACADYKNGENGETVSWLQRLSELDPNEEYSEEYELAARGILESWDSIAEPVFFYSCVLEDIKNMSEEEAAKYIGNFDSTKNYNFTKGAIYYYKLNDYKYGDGTLADLFSKYADELSYSELLPLCSILTEGQLSIAANFDISLLLETADNDDSLWKAVNTYVNEQKRLCDDAVSIYIGVDRSLFTDTDVALTSEALKREAATADHWYNNTFNYSGWQWFAIGATVVSAASAIGVAVYMQKALTYGPTLSSHTIVSQQVWDEAAGEMINNKIWSWTDTVVTRQTYSAGAITTAYCIAIGLSLIALGVFVGLSIYNYYHPDYADIPNIIVNTVTDENGAITYAAYHAVTGENGEAADLNSWSGMQWNALYYSKEASAGDPITADIIIQTGANKNVAEDAGYSPIHYFGDTVAFNTNEHTYGDGQENIYLFFKTDPTAFSGSTGSVFGTGTLALTAGLSAIVGILLGCAGMAVIIKRKNKASAK